MYIYSYYLDYGGFGFGSPSQRQKQHQKYRAVKANEAVFQHRYRCPHQHLADRLVTLKCGIERKNACSLAEKN
jgi:hypothetical protein